MERIGQLYRRLIKEKITTNLDNNENLFIVSFDKVVAADVSSLRQSLKDQNASTLVTKNRIVKKVLGQKSQDASSIVLGNCAFVFTDDDPIKVSKVLISFQKDHGSFDIKGGLIKGKLINKAEILSLSKLGSKKDVQARVVMQLKSPLFRLVGVLNQNVTKIVLVLKAIKEKKEKDPAHSAGLIKGGTR